MLLKCAKVMCNVGLLICESADFIYLVTKKETLFCLISILDVIYIDLYSPNGRNTHTHDKKTIQYNLPKETKLNKHTVNTKKDKTSVQSPIIYRQTLNVDAQ